MESTLPPDWFAFDDLGEHAEAALRLSPRGGFGAVFVVIGGAHFIRRRYDEAVQKLLLAIQDTPDFPLPHRILAACYAQMGLRDEAREIVERLRRITPAMTPGIGPWRNPEDREFFLSGLRMAMGEEL
jgi:adenylate cyclase